MEIRIKKIVPSRYIRVYIFISTYYTYILCTSLVENLYLVFNFANVTKKTTTSLRLHTELFCKHSEKIFANVQIIVLIKI